MEDPVTTATAEARQCAQLARHIREVVDQAPPLSNEQVELLRRLLHRPVKAGES